jgi:hypothetical protein
MVGAGCGVDAYAGFFAGLNADRRMSYRFHLFPGFTVVAGYPRPLNNMRHGYTSYRYIGTYLKNPLTMSDPTTAVMTTTAPVSKDPSGKTPNSKGSTTRWNTRGSPPPCCTADLASANGSPTCVALRSAGFGSRLKMLKGPDGGTATPERTICTLRILSWLGFEAVSVPARSSTTDILNSAGVCGIPA